MLDTELIHEYNALERVCDAIYQRMDRTSAQAAYQRLSDRLARIDARMAEIERSVPPTILYAD